MKPWTAAVAACMMIFLLAGCAQKSADDAPSTTTTSSGQASSIAETTPPEATTAPPNTQQPAPATPPQEGHAFLLPGNMTVYSASVVINGTADSAALLVVTVDADASASKLVRREDGTWSYSVNVAPGRTNVTVTADDGVNVQQGVVHVTRLVQGTVQVDFRGVPGHTNRNDVVWVDVEAFASASYYEGQPVAHPDFANVHDLMVVWEQAIGVPVTYKGHTTLGQQLIQIDGVGDPTFNSALFWCYEVNAATAPLGITGMEFHPGDVIAWSLGSCA